MAIDQKVIGNFDILNMRSIFGFFNNNKIKLMVLLTMNKITFSFLNRVWIQIGSRIRYKPDPLAASSLQCEGKPLSDQRLQLSGGAGSMSRFRSLLQSSVIAAKRGTFHKIIILSVELDHVFSLWLISNHSDYRNGCVFWNPDFEFHLFGYQLLFGGFSVNFEFHSFFLVVIVNGDWTLVVKVLIFTANLFSKCSFDWIFFVIWII